jgi:hypothetical protein
LYRFVFAPMHIDFKVRNIGLASGLRGCDYASGEQRCVDKKQIYRSAV